jgi:hypothetical protein
MMAFVKKYWVWITVAVVAVVLIIVFSVAWKKNKQQIAITDANGNPVNFTAAQTAEATELAKRLHDDLNSGFFFGYNIWGNIGRDADAYWAFSALSDSMFAYVCQIYQKEYNRSLIADIRSESSLPTDTYVKVILAKADKLNIA